MPLLKKRTFHLHRRDLFIAMLYCPLWTLFKCSLSGKQVSFKKCVVIHYSIAQWTATLFHRAAGAAWQGDVGELFTGIS